MDSPLTAAINKLAAATRTSATAVQPPAPASSALRVPDLVAETDMDEVKRQVAGAIWKMTGAQGAPATYCFTPITRAMSGSKVALVSKVGEASSMKEIPWLSVNCEAWVPGALTFGAKAGINAAGFTVSNQPVTLSPAAGDKFEKLELTAGGGALPTVKAIDEALGLVGAAFSPLTGGGAAAPLLAVAGVIPSVEDALAEGFDLDEVTKLGVAGHEFDGPIRAGKMPALGFATATPSCDEVAGFLAGLVGDATIKGALAVVLAVDVAAATVAGAAAETTAVVAARAALVAGMHEVADQISDAQGKEALARIAGLRASGLFQSGGGGAIIRSVSSFSRPATPAPVLPPPAADPQAAALGHIVQLLQRAASPANCNATFQAMPSGPDPGFANAFAAIAAASGVAASPAGPASPVMFTPAPIPPPGQPPRLLSGLDVLRPAAGTAAALSDIDLLVQLGDMAVVTNIRAMASPTGTPDPMTMLSLSGVMAEATAAHVNGELEILLDRLRRDLPSGTSVVGQVAGGFEWRVPPRTLADAGGRLLMLERGASELRRLSTGSGRDSPALGAAPTAASSLHHENSQKVPIVGTSASAKVLYRACSAAALAPICTPSVVAAEAAAQRLADPLAEAYRLVSAWGGPADSFLRSNGHVTTEAPGKLAASFFACRLALLQLARLWLDRPVGRANLAAVDAELNSLAEGCLCDDLAYDPVLKLCGATPPTAAHMGGLLASSRARGVFGSPSGPTAPADRERALGVLGPIMHSLHATALGGRPAVGGALDLGLTELGHAAHNLDEARQKELFEDLFAVWRADACAARRDEKAQRPDLAAAVFTSQHGVIARIESLQEAVSAGKEAAEGVLAAAGRGGGPKRTNSDDDADGKKSSSAKRRDRKKKAPGAGSPAPAPAPAAAGSPAPAPAPAPAQGAGPRLKVASASNLIQVWTGKAGNTEGIIDAIDRLHTEATPGAKAHELPCAWPAIKGECKRKKDKGSCPKCDNRATIDPAVLSAVKALLSADALSKLDPGCALATAT